MSEDIVSRKELKAGFKAQSAQDDKEDEKGGGQRNDLDPVGD